MDWPLLDSHKIDRPVDNVLHLCPEFLEYGHDVGPDDLGLLADVTFAARNDAASSWIGCPLCRNIGERSIGRDDGDIMEEALIRWRTSLGVEVLGRRHVESSSLWLEMIDQS